MSKYSKLLIDELTQLLAELKDPITLEPLDSHFSPQINILNQTVFIVLTIRDENKPHHQALEEKIKETAEDFVQKYDKGLLVSVILTKNKTSPFKNIIAVASGKGGVGKSTTAIGLAYALSNQGFQVGFLDADIYGPSLPVLLGQSHKPFINDKNLIIPIEKDGIQFMSMGFLMQQESPVIWRGPMVSQAVQRFLSGVSWDRLDFLIIDLPPGTGDIQLTIIQKTSLSGAIIVSTPQTMALVDAQKAIAMFEKVQIPILGIVENMSYFICPHCQGHSAIFEHGGAQKIAQELQIPFLAEIPLDLNIRRICDEGQPDQLLTALQGNPFQLLAQNTIEQLSMDDPLKMVC